jgi:two-component system chemotaxis response regulator CheB
MIVARPGVLDLAGGPKVNYSRPAADRLFATAAQVYGPQVIGVVLTGGDGDGTAGLRAIKAAGGICVIQDPKDAEDPSMPTTAALFDSPDYSLPLAGIAPLLVQLTDSSRSPIAGEPLQGP